MQVKSENYINIQGWMITELGLKNSELILYALIYGFSQDRRSSFTGSLSYLMEWTQSSKQTVISSLRSLVEKGLIVKIETNIGGTKSVGYYATPKDALPTGSDEPAEVPDGGQNFGPQSQKIRPDRSKNLTEAVKKFDPIIIDKDIDINIINTPSSGDDGERSHAGEREKPGKDELEAEFETVWTQYPRRQGKQEAKAAFIAARRAGTSLEKIRAGIESYKRQIDDAGLSMRYVMQGGNWFEGQRWEDDKLPPDNAGVRPKNRALAYDQTRYSAEDLKRLGIDLGEDIYE